MSGGNEVDVRTADNAAAGALARPRPRPPIRPTTATVNASWDNVDNDKQPVGMGGPPWEGSSTRRVGMGWGMGAAVLQ